MAPRARIYFDCVTGTGIFLLVDGLSQFQVKDWPQFLAYLAVAVLSATCKFRIPGIPVTFSTTFAFVLIGIANFSLAEALSIGCVATIVQCLWRPQEKASARRLLFNVAAVCLGIRIAYDPAHFHLANSLDKAPGLLPLAALVYFVINTGLIAGMVALVEGLDFRTVWSRLATYVVVYYPIGGLIAATMIFANRTWGWHSGLFIVPLLYLTYLPYRAFFRGRNLRQAS